MKKTLLVFITLICGLLYSFAAAEKEPLVYKINIKQEIDAKAFDILKSGMRHAKDMDANCILIDLNTYGGLLSEADSMRTAIINSDIPVYVFINNNAASAGALISVACDRIYMRSGANIGAATVVNMTGEKAPDKYQSYMRSLIRSTAESHGKDTVVDANGKTVIKWKRDPKIAEAMVDEDVFIAGVIDSTKILTLTADEAVSLGYCEGIVENVPEIITRHLGFDSYRLETYNPTLFDHIKGFLMNGVVQSILIMLIIGGIYLEMKTPGFGLPSAVAITAAVLYFTPLYMDGYAQNWEILLFVVGLILIAFEIFVIPGFGVAGISGILFTVVGLFLSLVGNVNFNFDGVPTGDILGSTFTVLAGMIFSVLLIVFLASRIGKTGMLYDVALHADQEGFSSVPLEPKVLIGSTAVSATVLRPSGRVVIDGEYYDAVSSFGFIDKGQTVKVVKYENSQVYVVLLKDQQI